MTQAPRGDPGQPYTRGMLPDRPRARGRLVAAVAAPLALGASVAAGYTTSPTAAQLTYLVVAILLTLAAGMWPQGDLKKWRSDGGVFVLSRFAAHH